eukprot:TRINITY_DN9362_c0_g1_i5.p2 TRINITY_DN9362_c0_g1~~TRINITY_DN9362_c0_g1_i5.p2  ORF type:complete len:163 (-),score=10.35 TRINITY_DN9362_c0_g1_i5:33-521(-)
MCIRDSLNTVPTLSAMMSPGWSVNPTGLTPTHSNIAAVLILALQDSWAVMFVSHGTPGDNARVGTVTDGDRANHEDQEHYRGDGVNCKHCVVGHKLGDDERKEENLWHQHQRDGAAEAASIRARDDAPITAEHVATLPLLKHPLGLFTPGRHAERAPLARGR